MSTVLWANLLVDGSVKSDQTDHVALYRHGGKLDAIAKELQLPSFLDICDTTDLRYNTDDLQLPEGASSTDEVMALNGTWIALAEAVLLLTSLRDHIVSNHVRFGLLSNQSAQVVAELEEVIAFAGSEGARAQKFNFSVVM